MQHDPLLSFDQQPAASPVTTPTKPKTNDPYDNRSLEDIDPFGHHHNGNGNGNGVHGEDYHHQHHHSNNGEHHNGTNGKQADEFNQGSSTTDLVPVDTHENEKSKSTSESSASDFVVL